MKKLKVLSLVLALAMVVGMISGCDKAEPVVEVTLTVDTEAIEMTVGDTVAIVYEVTPEDTEVTFASGDSEIATVDEDGCVTAVAEGETEVTVTAGEVVATVALIVVEVVEETPDPVIMLAAAETTLEIGETFEVLTAVEPENAEVVFESMDDEVATVDKNGLVTAVSAGEVGIIVTAGDISKTVVVTVNAQPVTPVVESSSSAAPAPPVSSSAPASSSAASAPAPSSSSAASKPASSSSNTASTVNTASGGYVGAKDECYPVTEGGKHYVVMCNGWSSVGSAGTKSLITTNNVVCGVCGVGVSLDGKVVSGGTSGSGSTSSQSTTAIDTAAYAREIIRLTNKARVAAGLSELPADDYGMSLAATRAEELATSYSHQRPGGGFAANEGWSENAAYGYASPQAAFDGWMGSNGHRAAILASDNVAVGAGCYYNGTMYWILLFSYE